MPEKSRDLTRFVKVPNAPDVPVEISIGNADTITFLCDIPFEVIKIHEHRPGGAAKNPFHRPLPFPGARGKDNRHRTNSGSAKGSTKGEYKITFHADGRDIDPHFIVDD